jgi:hypothetical protein
MDKKLKKQQQQQQQQQKKPKNNNNNKGDVHNYIICYISRDLESAVMFDRYIDVTNIIPKGLFNRILIITSCENTLSLSLL